MQIFPQFPAAESYEQITKFLQGYIDNELNFNQDDTCTNNCEDFTKTEHVRCADKTLCAQNRRHDVAVCSGSVRDCKELNNDDIQICYGDSDLRRYHYLKYSNGEQYGLKPKTQCSSINDVMNALIISKKKKTFEFGNLIRKIQNFSGQILATLVCQMQQLLLPL